MAETDFEYATDNDTDLQYKRMLGSGTYGSVHEVITLPLSADIDPLHSGEKSSITKLCKADGSHSQGNYFISRLERNDLWKRR